MQHIEEVNKYFNENYKSLIKYAGKIISDQKREYQPEDVLSELYLTVKKRINDIEKLDQFCKRFISNQIVFLSSPMNQKQSNGLEVKQMIVEELEEEKPTLKDLKKILTRREKAFLLVWELEGSPRKAILKCNISIKKGYELIASIKEKSKQLKSK